MAPRKSPLLPLALAMVIVLLATACTKEAPVQPKVIEATGTLKSSGGGTSVDQPKPCDGLISDDGDDLGDKEGPRKPRGTRN